MARRSDITKKTADAVEAREEPPVVARLVIEIRSDGSRTIARGAFEDKAEGERVMIEAEGASPIELAMSLAKSIFQLPAIARGAARSLLPGRSKKDPR